ncbi:MAG TPA: 3-dehydroquinate synthase [Puia sp.]|nr:3-dehydroquinate synthase [Puia sp.]
MLKKTFSFSASRTTCYFDASFAQIGNLVEKDRSIFITDQHIYDHHKKYFKGLKFIQIPAGESFKVQYIVDQIIDQLISFGADRQTTIIGVGGGVVTDITGYVASIYMRGVPFGFVPTSILGMVDASIGGKNGIDIGNYKNMIGVIRQPGFLFYDVSLLQSLPVEEWVNGFAEVIKHAAIKDASLFHELEKNSIHSYRKNKKALSELIRKNVMIKTAIVKQDEFEGNERRLLNFGHTLGHAVENVYHLPHGHAISIGIKAACLISEEMLNFKETARVTGLLQQYGLPIDIPVDFGKVIEIMRMDKKKTRDIMNYVLLEKLGKAVIKPIPMSHLEKLLYSIARAR